MGMTEETKNVFKILLIAFAFGSILALVAHFTEGEVKVDPNYVLNNKSQFMVITSRRLKETNENLSRTN